MCVCYTRLKILFLWLQISQCSHLSFNIGWGGANEPCESAIGRLRDYYICFIGVLFSHPEYVQVWSSLENLGLYVWTNAVIRPIDYLRVQPMVFKISVSTLRHANSVCSEKKRSHFSVNHFCTWKRTEKRWEFVFVRTCDAAEILLKLSERERHGKLR